MNGEQKEKFRSNLADKFAHLLEEKRLEWVQGWEDGGTNVPRNGATGNKYHGINYFALMVESICKGYGDPRWVTMAQIRDDLNQYHPHESWHLKAGSHGTKIEYWFPYDRQDRKFITWDQYEKYMRSGEKVDRFRAYPRYYKVFNASCVEGIKPFDPVHENENNRIDNLVETLSAKMNVPIEYDGGANAYYAIKEDKIHLPDPSLFTSNAELHGTALHELAHSTGHSSRLDRQIENQFGSESYAMEELIAEMTACFMTPNLSEVDFTAFNKFENNEAYLQAWIEQIRDKPESLVQAIKQAQRATDYMEFKAEIITEHDYKIKSGEALQDLKLDDLREKSHRDLQSETQKTDRKKEEITSDNQKKHGLLRTKESQVM